MGLAKRLRKLEGGPAQEFGDWPLEDQLESVARKIYDVKHFHQYHNPEHKYLCTDREIRLAMYIAEIIEAKRAGTALPPFDTARYGTVAKIPEIFVPYLRRWESGGTAIGARPLALSQPPPLQLLRGAKKTRTGGRRLSKALAELAEVEAEIEAGGK